MINFRKIAVSDYKKFNILYKQIEAESDFMLYEKDERKTTDEQQKTFLEKLASNNASTIFLAEDGSNLLGFIAVISEGPLKRKFSRYVAMGILEGFHGKKIGTKLMELCIQFCIEQDVKRIELTVITENTKAVNLYTKFGFEVEGIKRHSLFIKNNFVNELYMSKILN